MMQPRVLVLTLGGTISMTPAADGGLRPALGAQALLQAVPGLGELAEVTAESHLAKPGASLSFEDLAVTAARIRRAFDEGAEGVVVVQGTDTIEDTAFVLDLLMKGAGPVVVTGAMRPPGAAGADGPANLLAAVRVAASHQARGCGVLVVMNDELHAARLVQKTHTHAASAFASPGFGPVGFVAEGRVRVVARLANLGSAAGLEGGGHAPVAQVSLGLGEDGRILPTLHGLGYRGAVLEGMGAGHVPGAAVEAIALAVAQMPVVLCTRVRSGPVFTDTYGFAGSERDLLRLGVIPGGMLTGAKARLLLSLLLGTPRPRADIIRVFQDLA